MLTTEPKVLGIVPELTNDRQTVYRLSNGNYRYEVPFGAEQTASASARSDAGLNLPLISLTAKQVNSDNTVTASGSNVNFRVGPAVGSTFASGIFFSLTFQNWSPNASIYRAQVQFTQTDDVTPPLPVYPANGFEWEPLNNMVTNETSLPVTAFERVNMNGVAYRMVDVCDELANNPTGTVYFAVMPIASDPVKVDSNGTLTLEASPPFAIGESDHELPLSCGEAGSGACNLRTGMVTVRKNLFTSNGLRSPMSLDLVWSTDNKDSATVGTSTLTTGFPKGWKLNYQQYVYASGLQYRYVDANFHTHQFVKAENSTNIYYDAGGTGLLMTVSSSGYVITAEGSPITLTFDSAGRLTAVTTDNETGSNSASSITMTYNTSGQLTRITDGAGRYATLLYASGVVRISFSAGGSATLTATNGLLTSLTERDGGICTYTYDASNRLASMKDPAGEYAAFTYTTSHKLREFRSGAKPGSTVYWRARQVVEYHAYYALLSTYANLETVKHVTFCYPFDQRGKNGEPYEIINGAAVPGTTLIERNEFGIDVSYGRLLEEMEEGDSTKPIVFDEQSNDYWWDGGYDTSHTFQIEEDETDALHALHFFMATDPARFDPNRVFEFALFRCADDANTSVTEVSASTFPLRTPHEHEVILYLDKNLEAGTYYIVIRELGSEVRYGTQRYTFGNMSFITRRNGHVYSSGTALISGMIADQDLLLSPTMWHDRMHHERNFVTWGEEEFIITDRVMYPEDVMATYRSMLVAGGDVHFLWWNHMRNCIADAYNVILNYYGEDPENTDQITNVPLSEITALSVKNVSDHHAQVTQETEDNVGFHYVTYEQYKTPAGDIVKKESTVVTSFKGATLYEIDPQGIQTEYVYDDNGSVIEVYKNDLLTTAGRSLEAAYNYGGSGDYLTQVTAYRDGNTACSYRYDYYSETGNLDRIMPPVGVETFHGYSTDGENLTSVSQGIIDQYKYENTLSYVDKTSLLSNASCGGMTYQFRYNNWLHPSGVERLTVENNSLMTYPLVSETETRNDDMTRVVESTYGNGKVVRCTYDRYGRLVLVEEKKNASSSFVTRKALIYADADWSGGNVTSPFDETLSVSSTSLLRREVNDGDVTDYVYETNGRLLSEAGPVGITYTYDALGRVTKKTVDLTLNNCYTVSDTYEDADTSLWAPDPARVAKSAVTLDDVSYGRAELVWDNHGRLATRKTVTQTNKPLSATFTYRQGKAAVNATPLPVSVVHQFDSNTPYTETATYDTMDRLIAHSQPIGGTAAGASFKYSDEGLLARENQQRLGKTCTYTYDACGNVTSRKNYAYTTATSLGTATSTDTWVYDTIFPDRLVSYNGSAFAYDALGNPTTYCGKTTTWEGPQLASFDGISFTYDANGRRVQKSYVQNGKTITHTYTYAGGKLMTEVISSSDTTVADKKLTFLHTDAGLIGFLYNNGSNTTSYYYEYNMLGDVVALYTTAGTRMASYVYDAWGNHKVYNLTGNVVTDSSHIGNINPIRYRGYYYDTQTGFYYLNTRYYDPLLCRFISPDSTKYLEPDAIHGLNLYCYCKNNPLMYVDPNGTMPEWLGWVLSTTAIVIGIVLCATGVGGIAGGVLIGAGANSLINGYVTKAAGGSFEAGYIGGVISGAFCGTGAGLAGLAFTAAAETVGLAGVGYLALGVGVSFAGGFAGNLAGTIYTQLHDAGVQNINIDWQQTLQVSAIMGTLNIGAGMASAISNIVGGIGNGSVAASTQWASRVIAGTVAAGTEALYDLLSYIFSLLQSML